METSAIFPTRERRIKMTLIPNRGPNSPISLPHSSSDIKNLFLPVNNIAPALVPMPEPYPKKGTLELPISAPVIPPTYLPPITPEMPPSVLLAKLKRAEKASVDVLKNLVLLNIPKLNKPTSPIINALPMNNGFFKIVIAAKKTVTNIEKNKVRLIDNGIEAIMAIVLPIKISLLIFPGMSQK